MKKTERLIKLSLILTISINSCIMDNKSFDAKSYDEKPSVSIEDKIIIPSGFSKKYVIQREEDLSYNDISRKQVRITVPSGLKKEEVKNNIGHLVINLYKRKTPDGISVLVYEDKFSIEGVYTVAMGEFAPNGEWGKVNKNIPLKDYHLKIGYRESYFQPKIKTYSIGSKVTIFCEEEWNTKEKKFVPSSTVPLSNSAREWSTENIIINIPNNSEAEIIDIHQEKLNDGSVFIRYKIKTTFKGKNYQGWIHSEEIKK